MVKLTYFLIFLLVAVSCSKTDGCKDPMALNYDMNADESNQDKCRFSSVTFYAGGSTFEGIEVEKATISIGTDDPIGEITSFNHPYPSSCGETGTVLYNFGQSAVPKRWTAALDLTNGGLVHRSGDFEPDPNEECIRINVLP